ncbi:MAG: hypothetical protein R3A50_09555 [Saprospiraceae bacterium]
MNTKVLLAALAGAVVAFITGWLIWGMALAGIMESNTTEAGLAVSRGEMPLLWAIAVGCIAYSLLLALVYSRWAGISTFKSGAMGGAWIMLLIALGADFFVYAGMNVMNITAIIVDVVASAVQGAIVGGVIGWALGYGDK